MFRFVIFFVLAVCSQNGQGQRFLAGKRPPVTPVPSVTSPPLVAIPLLPVESPVSSPISNPNPLPSLPVFVSTAKNFVCPEMNGRWPMNGQCDAYIECTRGIAEEMWCPDGLVFNPHLDLHSYPCVYKTEIDCIGRERLQPPNATAECPHQYGYFRIGGSDTCGQFHSCVSGHAFVVDCPDGLAFNSETYRCDWPDQVADCDSEAYLGFTCPPPVKVRSLSGEWIVDPDFRFYRHANSCQHYYLCMETGVRLLGCDHFMAFDELTNKCEDIETVSSCPPELRKARAAERFL